MNLMTGDSERQLENLIHEIMEDSCARGIAAGVVDAEGNILYEKYFGWRDEEKKLPINRGARSSGLRPERSQKPKEAQRAVWVLA